MCSRHMKLNVKPKIRKSSALLNEVNKKICKDKSYTIQLVSLKTVGLYPDKHKITYIYIRIPYWYSNLHESVFHSQVSLSHVNN